MYVVGKHYLKYCSFSSGGLIQFCLCTYTHAHTHTHTHTHILRSGFASVVAYLLTREVWNSRAGLLAACFMAIVPGYISRSVAGSYDNEGIAIFALLFTHFLWLKSVKTGSVFWSVAASLSYFYMVGYPFLTW